MKEMRRNRKSRVERTLMAPAPSRSSSASPPSTWIELPRNVTINIRMRLGVEGMLSAQQVCCTWWNVCKDPIMWQVIDFSNPPSRKMNDGYVAMCQRAVDQSQGQLVELTIDSFGHNELINYVVNRSAANLKRLKLVSCIDISPTALTEAVAKLGQLEELHLIMMPSISSHDIVAIGNSCTNLRSFSLNSSKCGLYEDPFRCAEAIAKCMPNLHHLQLIANEMRNEVLKARQPWPRENRSKREHANPLQLCKSIRPPELLETPHQRNGKQHRSAKTQQPTEEETETAKKEKQGTTPQNKPQPIEGRPNQTRQTGHQTNLICKQ